MLDQAFIIALILSALNLAKMALRPHQVALLQDRLETWTLRLDSMMPTYPMLIRRASELRAINVFAISMAVMGTGVIVLMNVDSAWAVSGLGFILWGLMIASASGLWAYAQEVISESKIDSISLNGTTYLFIALCKSVAIILVLELLGILFWIVLFFNRKAYFKIQAFPAVVATVTVVYVVLLSVYPVLKLLLGILWRVVEHASGAWAAMLFIVAGVLGLMKVFAV